jgi:hypothetical protein
LTNVKKYGMMETNIGRRTKMARGLGAIMAEVKMAEARDRIERGDSIVCPVCGAEMEFNGCVWLCYEDNMPDDLRIAAEAAGFNPAAYYPHDGGIDVLAVVWDGENVRAILRPARDKGHFGGWLFEAADPDEKGDVPALVREYGLLWAEWAPDRLVGPNDPIMDKGKVYVHGVAFTPEEFVESYVMGGECPHMLPAYAPECGYKGECPYQGAGHYLPICGRPKEVGDE